MSCSLLAHAIQESIYCELTSVQATAAKNNDQTDNGEYEPEKPWLQTSGTS
jgi:hypothetical protein